MCKLLGVSRSGYYAWRDRPASKHAREDKALVALIRAACKAGRGIYGYRKVHATLKSDIPCGRDRVARLMRENGLQPKKKRRYVATTRSRHTLPVAPNLLARDFTANAPNEKWVADITYVGTDEGWLYLATIEDLFSRFIAGWAMEISLTDLLTRRSLEMALGRRQLTAGLICHSDRGSQYASHAFTAMLDQAHILPSMSRSGNAYDNAPMESFFSRLKDELIHRRHYRTRAEARHDIFEYIEVFYNRQRVHSALGYRSPADFEALYVTP
jgi:putative transposase